MRYASPGCDYIERPARDGAEIKVFIGRNRR